MTPGLLTDNSLRYFFSAYDTRILCSPCLHPSLGSAVLNHGYYKNSASTFKNRAMDMCGYQNQAF
jgi:hypothetical protein